MGYWGAGNDAENLELAKEADRLGYSVVWAAEAYGSDAATVLTWIAAHTERVDIGSAIFQIPGRSPAMTAMTAATLDTLSGGRFRLGVGISGPQVSEGWHGVRFDAPLGRTREYIDIVNLALSRQKVDYQGKHYQVPLPNGPGKALKLTAHPVRSHIPSYLAAIGPKNLELCGEKFDGWLGIFYSPEHSSESVAAIEMGRKTAGLDLSGFDIAPTVPMVIADDLEQAAWPVRAYAALYVGGMGSREKNFYNQLACRMGFEEAAATIQDLYLGGDKAAAMAAVPMEFIDQTSLIGPIDRISDRMQAYAQAGVTTLNIAVYAGSMEERIATVRAGAEALEAAGVGS
jgi:F420-dependent oxidoreductase-like protein